MRSKACMKCRQWKARCDLSEGQPDGCSRCRSLKVPCVFDASFKRTPRASQVTRTQIEHLKVQKSAPESCPGITNGIVSNERIAASLSEWSALFSNHLSTDSPRGVQETPQTTKKYFQFGNIRLSVGEANEYFRIYFTRCHQYLPFKLVYSSAELIHAKSQLLFWTICGVASNWKLSQIESVIKSMVEKLLFMTTNTVETVQALLLLCLWPAPISSLNEDTSHYLSGLATQISFQLGLHRPCSLHSHQYGHNDSTEVKMTTWLACFVVNQLQSAARGLPSLIHSDLYPLDVPDITIIDPVLSQLCRICSLTMQATEAISAKSSTSSGMLEPDSRFDMVKAFEKQFDTLQARYLEVVGEMVKMILLNSRLQLWSFILLSDIPSLPGLQDYIMKAKQDAIDFIDLCYDKNLSVLPFHIRWAMCYSAFILVNVLRLRQVDDEAARHNIHRVSQVMEATASSSLDIWWKASQIVRELPDMEDKKLRPPIFSRMGASIMYDSLRVYYENKILDESSSQQPDNPAHMFDLDGFDWCDPELLL